MAEPRQMSITLPQDHRRLCQEFYCRKYKRSGTALDGKLSQLPKNINLEPGDAECSELMVRG